MIMQSNFKQAGAVSSTIKNVWGDVLKYTRKGGAGRQFAQKAWSKAKPAAKYIPGAIVGGSGGYAESKRHGNSELTNILSGIAGAGVMTSGQRLLSTPSGRQKWLGNTQYRLPESAPIPKDLHPWPSITAKVPKLVPAPAGSPAGAKPSVTYVTQDVRIDSLTGKPVNVGSPYPSGTKFFADGSPLGKGGLGEVAGMRQYGPYFSDKTVLPAITKDMEFQGKVPQHSRPVEQLTAGSRIGRAGQITAGKIGDRLPHIIGGVAAADYADRTLAVQGGRHQQQLLKGKIDEAIAAQKALKADAPADADSPGDAAGPEGASGMASDLWGGLSQQTRDMITSPAAIAGGGLLAAGLIAAMVRRRNRKKDQEDKIYDYAE